MKIILAFIICCSSTICSADLFDLGLAELCNLINDHDLSEMKTTFNVDVDGDVVACSFDDKLNTFDVNGYLRSFRVLRYSQEPDFAESIYLKFEGLTPKISDPKVRTEYFTIMESLLKAVSENQTVVDGFLHAAANLEPNNAVGVDLDAMSIKMGYRVYTSGLSFYRLDIRNQCKYSLSDTANRSKCLSDRSSKAPAIVSTSSN